MWIFVLFDLPVDTPEARHCYTDFRRFLLDDGFLMLQYSVYARHAASEENALVHAGRVRANLPPDGEVRILTITERQFERMQVFHGEIRAATEAPPEQISFF
ncbi:MAG: CRISPR-associated endonuclease Cas2 [Gammaproteobacteria bacterium RIFOXYA12_FULL_61_12]|nr:MAG: CRISPR-associated endonuclease Cas2 [Gammaproteobacteria bacterium RIFOXYD12_FULL_61_37]OGT94185.1 MAG: CRISPR-associated endonuclease Cas2 [Gammaproteobacteria bacterium RIFOXYA12_FULL_61_12]